VRHERGGAAYDRQRAQYGARKGASEAEVLQQQRQRREQQEVRKDGDGASAVARSGVMRARKDRPPFCRREPAQKLMPRV